MGAFYRSYSIPTDVHDAVDQKIKLWLGRKGFQEIEDTVLDHDMETERAYFLLWNDDWTIVLYSHVEEDERLLFELSAEEHPVLHLWVYDSDIWGYDLYANRQHLTGFSSNPAYFGFSTPSDAPNDLHVLVERCALEGVDVSEIEKIQKKRGVFKERNCEEFARLIDAGPAASQYEYESEEALSSSGFSILHRRFRKRGFDPMGNFNLHARRARSYEDGEPPPAWIPPLSFRIIFQAMRIVLTPVAWLMAKRFERKIKSAEIPGVDLMGDGVVEREYTLEDGWLINRKRRCRIHLAEGADPAMNPGVLPFKIADDEVFSSTMSAMQTMNVLAGSQYQRIEEDANFWVASLPAKFVLTKTHTRDPKQPERFHYAYYIQAPPAVYCFSLYTSEALGSAELEVFRKTIESFEFLAPPETG